jgi:hypothetical protein
VLPRTDQRKGKRLNVPEVQNLHAKWVILTGVALVPVQRLEAGAGLPGDRKPGNFHFLFYLKKVLKTKDFFNRTPSPKKGRKESR